MKLAQILQLVTISLLPLYIIRFNIHLPGALTSIVSINVYPTTLLEILLVLTVVVTATVFLKSGCPFKLLKTQFDGFILLFIFSATAAIFYSYSVIGGLGILKAYFLEPVLLFYCLVFTQRSLKTKASQLSFPAMGLLISGVWLSGWAIVQSLTGSYSLAPHEISQGRVTAAFNSANALALYLGPLIPLALAQALLYKTAKKWLYVSLFFLLAVVLVWSRSRGGMIAETISLLGFTYALVVIKNKAFKKLWLVLPVVVLTVASILAIRFYSTNNFIPATFGQPYTRGDTLQIRYFIWAGTVNLLKDHPIAGAGLNGFKTLYSNQYRLPQFQEQFQYPHNLLLTWWVETGLLGLATFLLVLVRAFGILIRSLARVKNITQAAFGAGLLAMLIYIVVHGLVDVPYFKNDLSVQFWVIMAMIQNWSDQVKD